MCELSITLKLVNNCTGRKSKLTIDKSMKLTSKSKTEWKIMDCKQVREYSVVVSQFSASYKSDDPILLRTYAIQISK